ncbi:MAG: exodeoxyribonuclease III [Acidobacteria bacterium]|nr:exodeoxyribonuclease III [Acidobacteriota bacterium]
MRIGTWNVNGVRARAAQVREWMTTERPDIVCLQEIKASTDQVPAALCELEGYRCCWHGGRAYSGVGLHVRRDAFVDPPLFSHPPFDYENRMVTAEIGELTIASVYVPNGGKDFDAKLRFLEELAGYAAAAQARGTPLVICGDLNVARTDMDVHPKERKPGLIGQRPDERGLLERLIACGLVDVGRALDPDNEHLFTWWAPWRNLRHRNIGWRLDYVLASEAIARRARSCAVLRDFGTSDHAPVVGTFDLPVARPAPPPGESPDRATEASPSSAPSPRLPFFDRDETGER